MNQAREHGIRLIMVLTDSQGDYGGMAQYVRWAGPLTENVRDFYTSKRIRVSFATSGVGGMLLPMACMRCTDQVSCCGRLAAMHTGGMLCALQGS